MLWKCCTQDTSKFGKLSSGHRTGKVLFSFQSQRKAMPKNPQTTAQLHSPHMLVKQCSKFSKPGFSNTWTVNFQMFKLDLEKAEESEIKLPTSAGSSKKQEFQKNIYFCFIDCAKAFVWITINCGKFWKRLPYDPAIPLLAINLEKTIIRKDTCTPMLVAVLFMIAKQPRCPSAGLWIKRMCYIYTMEYHSAVFLFLNTTSWYAG